jgi:hypothetical protein
MTLLLSLFIFCRVGVPVEYWSPILSAATTVEDVALLSVTGDEETNGTWECERVGDQGRSHSCWQLMAFGAERERVRGDNYFAARLALSRIHASLRRCGGLQEYLWGRCEPLGQATRRLARARRVQG